MWCLRTLEVRDNPKYGWHFCPKCGKSWFSELDCRDQVTPRWLYDRYDFDDHIRLSTGKTITALEALSYNSKPESRAIWVIEQRDCWTNTGWSPWRPVFEQPKDPCVSDYKLIYQRLKYFRGSRCTGFMDSEFRIVLRKTKMNLTFEIPSVQYSKEVEKTLDKFERKCREIQRANRPRRRPESS